MLGKRRLDVRDGMSVVLTVKSRLAPTSLQRAPILIDRYNFVGPRRLEAVMLERTMQN